MRLAAWGMDELTSVSLAQTEEERERRGFAAVGGVSRVDWGKERQREGGVRRRRVVGLPFMGDGLRIRHGWDDLTWMGARPGS